jgi:hypothetical protein
MAMLKEIAPNLNRAALVGNPGTTAFDHFLRASEAAAQSLAMELVPTRVKTAADIEHEIAAFARVPNGGLLLPPDSTCSSNPSLLCGPSSTANRLSRMGLVLIVVVRRTLGSRMSCWSCVPLVWGRPGSTTFVIPARDGCRVLARI